MKAVLRLEFIGAATWDRLRQFDRFTRFAGYNVNPQDWETAAEYLDLPGPRVLAYRVTGEDAGTVAPIHGHRDYSGANSKGTRGVMVVYTLEEGVIYWIKEPTSWRSASRYFAIVDSSGAVLKMTKEEALSWASVHWA